MTSIFKDGLYFTGTVYLIRFVIYLFNYWCDFFFFLCILICFILISEYVIISTAIFFSILCFNIFCMNWRNKFISKFIVEKKLTFLFIILAFINVITFLVYFFKTDGLHRINYCTILSSLINVCICNFIYLME